MVALCALGLWGLPGEGLWGIPGEQGHLLFLWLFLCLPVVSAGCSFQAPAADPSLAGAVALAVIQGQTDTFILIFSCFFFPVLFLPPRVHELRTLLPLLLLFHRSGVAGEGCWEGAQGAIRFIFAVGIKAQLCLAGSARCCEYFLQE